MEIPIERSDRGRAHPCTLVHLANVSYRLGRTPNFDPENHQVVDDEANNLLRDGDRPYRAPYVVLEEV